MGADDIGREFSAGEILGFHQPRLFGDPIALYCGARWLVGAATGIARRLRVSPRLIGLTVVAVGTSLPELFVGVSAAIGGHPNVSLGNVIGANALLAYVASDGRVDWVKGGVMLGAMIGYVGANVVMERRERKVTALSGTLEAPHAASIAGDVLRVAVGAATPAVRAPCALRTGVRQTVFSRPA